MTTRRILGIALLLIAFALADLQWQVITLRHERAPAASAAPAQTSAIAARSPVEQLQVPAGPTAVGLQILGNHDASGGQQIELGDYQNAPAGWFTNGGWYVLVKRGWNGPGYCLVNADSSHWRTLCLSWHQFRWLVRAARRG